MRLPKKILGRKYQVTLHKLYSHEKRIELAEKIKWVKTVEK
jgi:hypothetical protein